MYSQTRFPQKENKEGSISPQVMEAFEQITNAIRNFGFITGSIFASVADWILGGLMLGILFNNYWDGIWSFAVGMLISMAAWGIQIILWQILFTNKLKEVFSKESVPIAIAFIFVVIMKLADDFTDVSSVYWILKDNIVQYSVGKPIYRAILTSVLFITWVITGFSEVFITFAIKLLVGKRNPPGTVSWKKPVHQTGYNSVPSYPGMSASGTKRSIFPAGIPRNNNKGSARNVPMEIQPPEPPPWENLDY